MSAMTVIGGGGRCEGWGTNVTSHVVFRQVYEDKISCLPRQLNGGGIETALDSNLIGLHLYRAQPRPSAKRLRCLIR